MIWLNFAVSKYRSISSGLTAVQLPTQFAASVLQHRFVSFNSLWVSSCSRQHWQTKPLAALPVGHTQHGRLRHCKASSWPVGWLVQQWTTALSWRLHLIWARETWTIPFIYGNTMKPSVIITTLLLITMNSYYHYHYCHCQFVIVIVVSI